jgi:hypothetical protein
MTFHSYIGASLKGLVLEENKSKSMATCHLVMAHLPLWMATIDQETTHLLQGACLVGFLQDITRSLLSMALAPQQTLNDQETSTDISMEQKSNGAAVVPDRVEERWSSDCTRNGHVILGTKNTSCGLEIGCNGSLDMNGLV